VARVVILEGTCGSGKTTLLRAAPSVLPDRDVHLVPQRVTYGPIAAREDAGTLDDAGDRDALRAITLELGGSRPMIVDTLHATHFVRAGALSVASFVEIDRALGELDVLVVVLRISEAAIRERAIHARRGTGFETYARKFGATEDERVRYFAREQDRLLELLQVHSQLRRVVLDGDEPRAALAAQFRDAVA
jgi:hypothetical protein